MYKFLVIWKITVGRFSSFFSLFCLYFSFCSHHLHEEHRCQGASVRVKNKKNVTVLIFHRHQRQRHRFCLLFFGSEASNYQMILLSFIVGYPMLLFFVYQQIAVAYMPKVNSPRFDLVKCSVSLTRCQPLFEFSRN